MLADVDAAGGLLGGSGLSRIDEPGRAVRGEGGRCGIVGGEVDETRGGPEDESEDRLVLAGLAVRAPGSWSGIIALSDAEER